MMGRLPFPTKKEVTKNNACFSVCLSVCMSLGIHK